MSIITISRGSYSQGTTVAAQVASRLGYRCIGRDVLLDASKEFNIPEIKLVRAIENAPSILERFTYGKEKYIAFIQAAILRQLREDSIVYHGFAGHFFVRGIPHVLKIRIIADPEDRVRREMERERISRKEALRLLQNVDEERRKWSLHLYGIDTSDPSLYDLVIHIGRITVEDAVETIIQAVQWKQFQTTPESQKALEDLALSAEVRAALVNLKPDVVVSAKEGTVYISTKVGESQDPAMILDLERIAKGVAGVKEVKLQGRSQTPHME
jgi:cytidylate kinase